MSTQNPTPPQQPTPPSLTEALKPLLDSLRGIGAAANAASLHALIGLWARWALYIVLLFPVILAIITLAWADNNFILAAILDLAGVYYGELSTVLLAFLALLFGPLLAIPFVLGIAIITWLNEHAHRTRTPD